MAFEDSFRDPAKTAKDLYKEFISDERIANADLGWARGPNGQGYGTIPESVQEVDAAGARTLITANDFRRNSYRDPFAQLKSITDDKNIVSRVHELAPQLRDNGMGKSFVQTNGGFKQGFVESSINVLRDMNQKDVQWVENLTESLVTASKAPGRGGMLANIPALSNAMSGMHGNMGGMIGLSMVQAGQSTIHAAVSSTNSSALSALLINKVHAGVQSSISLSAGGSQKSVTDNSILVRRDLNNAFLHRVFTTAGVAHTYDNREDKDLIRSYDVDVSQAPMKWLRDKGRQQGQVVEGIHRTNLLVNERGVHFSSGNFTNEALGSFDTLGNYRRPKTEIIDLSVTLLESSVSAGDIRREVYDRIVKEAEFTTRSIFASPAEKERLAEQMGLGYRNLTTSGWQTQRSYVRQAQVAMDDMFGSVRNLVDQGKARGARLTISTNTIATKSGWAKYAEAIEAFTREGGEVVLLVDKVRFGKGRTGEMLNAGLSGSGDLLAADYLEPKLDKTHEAKLYQMDLRLKQQEMAARGWTEASHPREWQQELASVPKTADGGMLGFMARAARTGNFRVASTFGREVVGKGVFLQHGGESNYTEAVVTQGNFTKSGERVWNPATGQMEFIAYSEESAISLNSHDFKPLAQQVNDWQDINGVTRYFSNPNGLRGVGTALGQSTPGTWFNLKSVLYGLGDKDVTGRAARALGNVKLNNLSLMEFDSPSRFGGKEKLRRTDIGFNAIISGSDGSELVRLRIATQDGRLFLTDHNVFASQAVVFTPQQLDEKVMRRLRADLGRAPTEREVIEKMGGIAYNSFRKVGPEEMLAASVAALDRYYEYAIEHVVPKEIQAEMQRNVGGRHLTKAELDAGVKSYLKTKSGQKHMQGLMKTFYKQTVGNFEEVRAGRPLYEKALQTQALFFEENYRDVNGTLTHDPWGFMMTPARRMDAKTATTPHGMLDYYQRTQDFYGENRVYDPVTGNPTLNMPKGYLESMFETLDVTTIDHANPIFGEGDKELREQGLEGPMKYMVWIPLSKMMQQSQRLKAVQSSSILEMASNRFKRTKKNYANAQGDQVDGYRMNVLMRLGGTALTDTAFLNPLAVKGTLLEMPFKKEIKVDPRLHGKALLHNGQVFKKSDEYIRIYEDTFTQGLSTLKAGMHIENPMNSYLELGHDFILDEVAQVMDPGSDVARLELRGRIRFRPDAGYKTAGVKATVGMGAGAYFADLHAKLMKRWSPEQAELAKKFAGVSQAEDIHLLVGSGTIKTADVLLDFSAGLLQKGAVSQMLPKRSDAELIRDFSSLSIDSVMKFVGEADAKTSLNNYDPAFRNQIAEMVHLARSAKANPANAATIAAELRQKVTNLTKYAPPAGSGFDAHYYTTQNRSFRTAGFLAMHLYMRFFVDEQKMHVSSKQTYHSDLDLALTKSFMTSLNDNGWFSTDTDHMSAHERKIERDTMNYILNHGAYLPLQMTGGLVASVKPVSSVSSTSFMNYYGFFHDKELFKTFQADKGTQEIRASMTKAFGALMYNRGSSGTAQTIILPGSVPNLALLAEAGMGELYGDAALIQQDLWRGQADMTAGLVGGAPLTKNAADYLVRKRERLLGERGTRLQSIASQINSSREQVAADLHARGELSFGRRDNRVFTEDWLVAAKRANLGTMQFVVPLFSIRDTKLGYRAQVQELGLLTLPTADDLMRLFPKQGMEVNNTIRQIQELSFLYANNQEILSHLMTSRDGGRGKRIYNELDLTEKQRDSLRKMERTALSIQSSMLNLFATDFTKLLTGGFKLKGRAQAPLQGPGVDLGTTVVGRVAIKEMFHDRALKVVEERARERAEARNPSNKRQAAAYYKQEFYSSFGLWPQVKELTKLVRGIKSDEIAKHLVDTYGGPGPRTAKGDPMAPIADAIEARLAEATAARRAEYVTQEAHLEQRTRATQREYLNTMRFRMSDPNAARGAMQPGFGWHLNVDVDAAHQVGFEGYLKDLGLADYHATSTGTGSASYRISVGNRIAADDVTAILEKGAFSEHIQEYVPHFDEGARMFSNRIMGTFHVGGKWSKGGVTGVATSIQTSGPTVGVNQITEIGGVMLWRGQVTSKFNSRVNPGHEINPTVTHVTNTQVQHAPGVDQAVTEFLNFAGNKPLVFHDASFGMGFLTPIVDRLGFAPVNGIIDVVDRAKTQFNGIAAVPQATGTKRKPGQVWNYGMNSMAKAYGLPVSNAHSAIQMAETTAGIWGNVEQAAHVASGAPGQGPLKREFGRIAPWGLDVGTIHYAGSTTQTGDWVPVGLDERFQTSGNRFNADGTRRFTPGAHIHGLPQLTNMSTFSGKGTLHRQTSEDTLIHEYGANVTGYGGSPLKHWGDLTHTAGGPVMSSTTGILGQTAQVTYLSGLKENAHDVSQRFYGEMNDIEARQDHLRALKHNHADRQAEVVKLLQDKVLTNGSLTRQNALDMVKPYTADLGTSILETLVDRTLLQREMAAMSASDRSTLQMMDSKLGTIIEHAANFRHGVRKGDQMDMYLREYRKTQATASVRSIMQGTGTLQEKMDRSLSAIIQELIIPSAEFSTAVSLRAGSPMGGTSQLVASVLLSTTEYRSFLTASKAKGGRGVAAKEIVIGESDYGIYEHALAMMTNQGDWDGDLKSWAVMEGLAKATSDYLASGKDARRRSAKSKSALDQLSAKILENTSGRGYVEFAARWSGQTDMLAKFDEQVAKEADVERRSKLSANDPEYLSKRQYTDEIEKIRAKQLEMAGGAAQVVQQTAGLFSQLKEHALLFHDFLGEQVTDKLGDMRAFYKADGAVRAEILAETSKMFYDGTKAGKQRKTVLESDFNKMIETMGAPITETGDMLKFVSEYVAFSSSEVIGKAFNDSYNLHMIMHAMSTQKVIDPRTGKLADGPGYGITQEGLDIVASVFTRGLNQLPRDAIKPKSTNANFLEEIMRMMKNPQYSVEGRVSGAKAAFNENVGTKALGLLHSFLMGSDRDYFGEDIWGFHDNQLQSNKDMIVDGTLGTDRKIKRDAHRVIEKISEQLAAYMLDTVGTSLSSKVNFTEGVAATRSLLSGITVLNDAGQAINLQDVFHADASTAKAARDSLKQVFANKTMMDGQGLQSHVTDQLYEMLTRAFSTDAKKLDPKLRGDELRHAIQNRDMQVLKDIRLQIEQTSGYEKQMRQFGVGTGFGLQDRMVTFNKMSARSGQYQTPAMFTGMLHDIAFGGTDTVQARLTAASGVDSTGLTRSMMEGLYEAVGIDITQDSVLTAKPTTQRDMNTRAIFNEAPELWMNLMAEGQAKNAQVHGHGGADVQAQIEKSNSIIKENFVSQMGIHQNRADARIQSSDLLGEMAQSIERTPWKAKFHGHVIGAMGAVGALIYERGFGNVDEVASAGLSGIAMAGHHTMGVMMKQAMHEGGVTGLSMATGAMASLATDVLYAKFAGGPEKAFTARNRLVQGLFSLASGVLGGAVVTSLYGGKPIAKQMEDTQAAFRGMFDAIAAPLWSEDEDGGEAADTLDILNDDGEVIEMADEADYVESLFEAA